MVSEATPVTSLQSMRPVAGGGEALASASEGAGRSRWRGGSVVADDDLRHDIAEKMMSPLKMVSKAPVVARNPWYVTHDVEAAADRG